MLYCEKKQSNKANRKVSKYFDKKGEIKKELSECISWIENNFLSKIDYFEKLFYDKLSQEIREKNKSYHKRKKWCHRCNDLKNRRYVESLYSKVIFENRFYVAKRIKKDGAYIYEKYDMYRFIITLIYACQCGKIREFIDVPDVFFIVKQLKLTGLQPYVA